MKGNIFLKWITRAAVTGALIAIVWTGWIPRSRPRGNDVTPLGRLPLSFEVNRGQANQDAKFVARGGGYALLLTGRGEPVLALHGRPRQPKQRRAEAARNKFSPEGVREPAERTLLRLEFLGSNAEPEVEGEQPLPGHSNYLLGNDPKQWLTGVPHFARVRYREVYPGIDVLYYTRDQQLEYDFILRPGTDPNSIRLAVRGAQETKRGELGGLVLKTAAGRVFMHKPVAYQQGPSGEREVECNYVLDGKGEVRFALGEYDPSLELRIDPVLTYSALFNAEINAIAVDSSGNSYLAGTTIAVNFPTTPGAFQPARAGIADAVIAKLDPTGSTLVFATYLGGNQVDIANSIALDNSGNVILAGSTESTNFPVRNAFQTTRAGNTDAFLSKLDPTGMQLLYSTYLGGQANDSANGVRLDASGLALVAGQTSSSNFPTSAGAFRTTPVGGMDAFVAKLNTSLAGAASLVFSTYLGGNFEDVATAIAVDATGNALIAGWTFSSNFPTVNAFQPTCASCSGLGTDAFVTRLNNNGTALLFSTFLGGTDGSTGLGIAVDSQGNAYVTGATFSSDFPTTAGAFQTTFRGLTDAFVSKIDPAGSALLYSTFIGGSSWDSANGIAVDGAGNAFLTGYTYSNDFPLILQLQGSKGVDCTYNYYGTLYPYQCSDAIVPQINASGSALLYSTYLGGAGANDVGRSIALDAAGNAYVAGTGGATFPHTPGAVLAGGAGFAAKISPQNAASFSLDTRQVNFGSIGVGTTISPVGVQVSNLGSAPLNISSITTSGDFAQTNDCGSSVGGGSHCTIQVTFIPSAPGPHQGMLTVHHNAAGSPHSTPLTGSALPPSTTTLTSSLNPSAAGQAVTFTATVTPPGATGLVVFQDFADPVFGVGALGDVLLDANGVATVTTTHLSAGTHPIMASYVGDANFTGSDAWLTQVVGQVSTTTTLTSSQNPSNLGQSVTFTAAITPAVATGQVNFLNGATQIGSATLNSNGMAMFSTSALPGGSHSITADYPGNTNFVASTSAVVTQTVNSISLMTSSSSATVARGATATFQLTVGQAGTLGAPVTFSCSGLPVGWSCGFSPASVPAGSGPTPVTLTIQAGSATAQNLPLPPSGQPTSSWAAWMAALLLLMLGIQSAAHRGKAAILRPVAALALVALFLVSAGCGGGASVSTPTPPNPTTTITVSAVSGSTTTSMPFTITVR